MLSTGAERRSQEILGNLSEDERDLVISMPYRVGMYVSNADETGGDEAHLKEFESLMNILTGISEDFCKSEIMQKILYETVGSKTKWRLWNADLDKVPEQCEHIVDLLSPLVDQQSDILSVKETLLDIGVAVAMAFREADDDVDQATIDTGFFGKLRQGLSAILPKAESDARFEHLNISKAERAVLAKITKVLDI